MSLFDKRSTATTMEDLKAEWHDCKQCPFYAQRSHVVFGWSSTGGTVGHDLFAVGQAPAGEEDESGVPFTGPGGQITKREFRKVGIPEDKVWWTNVLACKPLSWTSVREAWVQHCWDRLEGELKIIKPKLIVAMGVPATRRFIPNLPTKGEVRGRQFMYEGIPGVSVIHPAVLNRPKNSRTKSAERAVADDMELVRRLYDELA